MPDDLKVAGAKSPKVEKVKEISLPSAVLALAATPDGGTVFAACQDGGVFRVETGEGKTELLGRHDSYASGVARLPDGRTIISAGYDGVLQWHDLAERRTTRKIQAHAFWSWDLDLSREGSLIASVTGRYEAGGYKYEPAPEQEPSVKVFDVKTGELRRQFSHVPPVQAVAMAPDGRHVAAGNLMGEIRVWEIPTGKLVSQWTTPDLTSWGIIKSHHYLGGVFDLTFNPDGDELYACGMGPMRDPMAGNGVQRWQRFAWRDGRKLDETHEGESGQGLMEALAFHPSQKVFAMGGRLFQGQWNLALFETSTGRNLHALDAKHRITDALFTSDGAHLILAKAKGQEKKRTASGRPMARSKCIRLRREGEETPQPEGTGFFTDSTFLVPAATEHILNGFGAGRFPGTKFCAGVQEHLDGGGVVSGPGMPAMHGTMHGPPERRALKVRIGHFERGLMTQDLTGHLQVAMKGGPMQRGGAMLAEGIHRQAGRQHRVDGGRVVVARRMRHLALVRLGEVAGQGGVLRQERLDGVMVARPPRRD